MSPLQFGRFAALALAVALSLHAGTVWGEAPKPQIVVEFGVAAALLLLLLDRTHFKVDRFAQLGAAILTALALIASLTPDPNTRLVGPTGCEMVDAREGRTVAKTEGMPFLGVVEYNNGKGIVARANANRRVDSDVTVRLLPGLCLAGFEGFCIGEAVPDYTGGEEGLPLDQQWFVLPDKKGYVSASVVQELSPGTTGRTPSHCSGGETEPRRISLGSVVPEDVSGTVELRLQAPHAVTVGVAVFARDDEGNAEWRQVGMDATAEDGFLVSWDTTTLMPQADVTVLYTVCWSGNVPGRARDSIKVNVIGDAADSALARVPRPAHEGRGAEAACASEAGGR